MKKTPVLIIAGPTASGKSSLAIAAAKAFGGVIINSDSMQVYRDIPVIAATPSEDEKLQAEHRLYELYDCSKRGNVVDWLNLCVAEIKELWSSNRLPIVVGGTGMYIDALLNGVTPIPEVPENTRNRLRQELADSGLAVMYEKLLQADPEIGAKLNRNDKTRIMRALEIYDFTGVKVSEWYKIPLIKRIPEADFLTVKIMPSLAEIEANCRQRLDDMVYKFGALAEIESLLQKNLDPSLPAMKALGVPELSRFVRGEISLEAALEEAKLHTRQYAKRQRTWLNNKLKADIVFTAAYKGQEEYLRQIRIGLQQDNEKIMLV